MPVTPLAFTVDRLSAVTADVLTFLEALDRLVGRLGSDQDPDNRYVLAMLDLVEAEHERARASGDPGWPDTLWTDYRLGLVVVRRHLAAIFDHYPEPPTPAVRDRAVEVTRWLVLLAGDVRRALGTPRTH
jgi:hypothetical protein